LIPFFLKPSKQNLKVSAVVPCLNQWDTLPLCLESIMKQSLRVCEIILIDDGSKTKCPDPSIRNSSLVRILRNEVNQGRGFSRALASREASGQFLLFVDATNQVEERFVEKCFSHFDDPKVAAVSGTYSSQSQSTAVDRWRSRHLFRESLTPKVAEPCKMLITYGTMMRTSAVMEAGNFNPNLRYKEDQELGERLGKLGYFMVGDPGIKIYPSKSNSLAQILERYARWNMDPDEKPSVKGYFHNLKASIKPMMQEDLKEKDLQCALISLLVPHLQLFHGVKTYIKNKNEK